MRKTKQIKNVITTLSTFPSQSVNEKELKLLFESLVKKLEITKEISVLDNLYIQPFVLENVQLKDGMKEYFTNLKDQLETKQDKYIKLTSKRDGKLVVLKSFGKVIDAQGELLEHLLLLIRISQYIKKSRELYALEVSMLQILK